MDDMFLQCNKNAIYVLNTSYRYGQLDMINLFGSPAGRAITEITSLKSFNSENTTAHLQHENYYQQDPKQQPQLQQNIQQYNYENNYNNPLSFKILSHPINQHMQHQAVSIPTTSLSLNEQHQQQKQLQNSKKNMHFEKSLLLEQQQQNPYNNHYNHLRHQQQQHQEQQHCHHQHPQTDIKFSSSIIADNSKKSVMFKSSNSVIAKKSKFWKFLEDDKSKKDSLEDLSTSRSGKSISLSKWRRQNPKSSSELYREAAQLLGLSCKLSDSCRCLDCQSRYFDCDDSDTFSENSFSGDLDGVNDALLYDDDKIINYNIHEDNHNSLYQDNHHQLNNPSNHHYHRTQCKEEDNDFTDTSTNTNTINTTTNTSNRNLDDTIVFKVIEINDNAQNKLINSQRKESHEQQRHCSTLEPHLLPSTGNNGTDVDSNGGNSDSVAFITITTTGSKIDTAVAIANSVIPIIADTSTKKDKITTTTTRLINNPSTSTVATTTFTLSNNAADATIIALKNNKDGHLLNCESVSDLSTDDNERDKALT